MRPVRGEVVLPADAPRVGAKAVHVEVRDVAVADAPSTVVASTTLRDRKIGPGGRLKFSLQAPDAGPHQRLELRVHVDVAGGGHVAAGDLLTTQSIAVPASGACELTAPVSVV